MTLTYHESFPSPRVAKLHLKRFKQRLQRAWGRWPGWWKLEPQSRGAPHFHLLLLVGDLGADDDARLLPWVAEAWNEIAGGGSLLHLGFHLGELGNGNKPCVERVRDWHGVSSYAAKYMGKVVKGTPWEHPGKWWGTWFGELLPISIVTAEVPAQVAAVVRRQLIRFFEHQPSGRSLAVSVSTVTGRKFVRRGYFSPAVRSEYVSSGFMVRPYHRRWRCSRGGCSMLVSASTFKRVMSWAWELVTGEKSSALEEFLASQSRCEGVQLC